VNMLAGNLTNQVRNIAFVTTAVANGDLSQKITVEAKGEILELKDTINAMVEQLRTFASEVTRIARQVGTEGKLGAQADIKASRDVEGPDGQRELARREPHDPGPQQSRRSRPRSRTATSRRRSRSRPRERSSSSRTRSTRWSIS